MAILRSLPLALKTKMPAFSLNNPEGIEYKSEKLIGKKGLLIVFTCNHCPYAQAVWERVIDIAGQAKKIGINTVAINPNIHPDYPEDSSKGMKKLIKKLGIKFPYLVDSTQEVAKSYNAQCTPDIYLLDKKGSLFYHGRIDDNWQNPEKVKRRELLSAINSLANDLDSPKEQIPSMGCSIKWRI